MAMMRVHVRLANIFAPQGNWEPAAPVRDRLVVGCLVGRSLARCADNITVLPQPKSGNILMIMYYFVVYILENTRVVSAGCQCSEHVS